MHRPVRRTATVLLLAGLLPAAGCGGAGQPEAPATSSNTAPSPTREALVRVLELDLDDAAGVAGPAGTLGEGATLSDSSGAGRDGVVHLAGGQPVPLRAIDHDGGGALAFPGPCDPADDCPKAVVEVEPTPALDPDDDAFAYGATVLLAPDQTSKGSNVLQKGFSVGGESQWKLQIDGVEGLPSCLLVGRDDDDRHQARSDVTVADGTWHELRCERTGDELVLLIDGDVHATVAVPEDLAVSPPGPVRIGGKSLKRDNDQFFGAVDEVYVETARES